MTKTFTWKQLSGIRAKYCPALIRVGFNYVNEKELIYLEQKEDKYESFQYELAFLPYSTALALFLHKCSNWLVSNHLKQWDRLQRLEVLTLTQFSGAAIWASSDYNDVGYDPLKSLVSESRKDYLVPLTLDRLNRLTPKARREFLDKWERDTLFSLFYKDILNITEEEYTLLKYGIEQDISYSFKEIIDMVIKVFKMYFKVNKRFKSNDKLIPFANPSEAIKVISL